MKRFDDDMRKTLAETRLGVAETAFNHVTTAIGLFRSSAFSQAAFFAITSIEEMGKARTLQIVQMEAEEHQGPVNINVDGIEGFLYEHRLKATRAAASALSVNHGAVRRHGRHKEADLNLTSGILFLTQSNQWMDIRNSCIYVDVNLHNKKVNWPVKEVTGDHAYYFICMALEIIAKESAAGFGSPVEEFERDSNISEQYGITDFETASEFEDRILALLQGFIDSYQDDFDESNLDFFTEHPQYDSHRQEIREREVRMDDSRRSDVKEMFETMIEDSEAPSEEDKEILPEGVSHEEYQDQIIEYMTDSGMDLPYYTHPGMHPDVKELREYVLDYLDFE